ncbi:MAG: GNAT family protein [Erysipelotrichaceae bacterium]|nr:GNAT family protein [Erysipelotrichaceae bacterium]
MITLKTERLTLRRWITKDIFDFHEFMGDEKIATMAGFKPHESLWESRILLDIFIKKDYGWAIYHNEDKKVIGFVSLNDDPKRATSLNAKCIGYSLTRKYWGKGLMVEAVSAVMSHAFNDLKISLLAIYHYPDNQRSKRVIEKLGFIYEGCLRQSAILFNHEVKDECCYSLTASEYYKINKK